MSQLPEDIQSIDITEVKKQRLAEASELKRTLLGSKGADSVDSKSAPSYFDQVLARHSTEQEKFNKTWVGKSGVDRDSFTAGVIDGAAMLTAGTGYLAGTLLSAAPNAIAALQELGTGDDVKEAYTRFKQGKATEADIALLDQKQDLFTTNRQGLERADYLREGTRGIMDALDWRDAIYAPEREDLRNEFKEEAGPAVDRLAQAWEQAKQGEYLDAAAGAATALPKVAYEIAENAVQHPVASVSYGLENAPQIGIGLASKAAMGMSNAGYALDELRQGMDAYEEKHDGARPSGEDFREMLLRAGSLAAAEQVADSQVLKAFASPVTKHTDTLAEAAGDLVSKVANKLPKAVANPLARAGSASATVAGTGMIEAGTEGFQTYQEGEIKGETASPMDIAEGALLGFAGGGSTAAVTQAPVELMRPRKDEDPLVQTAVRTGDISPFLTEDNYAPDKAAEALVKRSEKIQDSEQQQADLTRLTEVKTGLQDRIKAQQAQLDEVLPDDLKAAQSLKTQLQERLETVTDPQKRALFESSIQQADEILEKGKPLIEEAQAPVREQLDRLNAQLASVEKAEETLTARVQPEALDIPAQVDLADTDLETATPEVQQSARQAAERVVSLAMSAPDQIDPLQAERLANNTKNSLTEAERAVLRTFSKAKTLAHQLKSADDVRTDIFEGNPKEGYKGLNEYTQAVGRALNQQTPDVMTARREIQGLHKFVQSRKAKLATAQQAFDAVRGTDQEQQWVRDKSGNWLPADRKYSRQEIHELGGMTIHPGSGGYVGAIAMETEALQASLDSLKAMYQLRKQTPAAAPVAQPASKAPTTATTDQPAPKAVAGAPEVKAEKQAEPAQGNTPEVAVSQSEAVAEQAPVEAEAPKTGKLSLYDREDPELAADASEDQKYRSMNLIKRYFKQQAGNPKTGTQRPLVKVHNLLSQWKAGQVRTLDYLPMDELTEEQLGVTSLFIRMASKWMPTIEGNFFKRDAKQQAYAYNDYTQFLQDENGQVDENVKTAIAAAAFSYIASEGGTRFNDESAINTILRRQKDTFVGSKERKLFSDVGTGEATLVNTLGRMAISMLGIEAKDAETPVNERARLEIALGAQVLGLLMDQGIVESVDRTEWDIRQFTATEGDFTQKQVAEMKARPRHFIRFKRDKEGALVEDAREVHEGNKRTSGLFDKLMGNTESRPAPSLKPLEFDQKTANNSTKAISAAERKALEKEAKAPYVLAQDMVAVLGKLDETIVLEMAGMESPDSENAHISNRRSIEAKNEGLRKEYAALMDFIQDLGSRARKGLDQAFYLMPEAWKNDRVGLASLINPQTSKIHRAVVGKASAQTTVRWTLDDTTNLDIFKLRVAEGLGVKTDKTLRADAMKAYADKIKKPEIMAAVEALRRALRDEDLTQVDQEVIRAGVKEGGEKMHSLQALVAQATYENAETDGLFSFTTHLTAEVDGVTNGPMFGHLLFGAFDSVKQAFQVLNKGGFFEIGSRFKQYNAWRSQRGNTDLYETQAELLTGVVQQVMKKASERERKAYSALWYITGDLAKKGRNLMKGPVTKSGYGENLNKTVDTMAEEFVQSVYDHIQDIARGESKLQLKPLLQRVRFLMNTFDNGSGDFLNVDMSLAEAMEMEFSQAQVDVLKEAFQQLLGQHIKTVTKEYFQNFVGKRQVFNESANMAFGLYQQLYTHRKQQLVQQLIAEGTMPTNPTTGEALRDLNKAEMAQLQEQLKGMSPQLHTALSKLSDEIEAGLLLAKRDKGMSEAAAYRNQIKFGSKGQKPRQMVKGSGNEKGLKEPGVAGAIGSIHSFDAAVSIMAGEKVDSINVHDARIFGLKEVFEGAKALNEMTVQHALNYSPMSEMVSTMERIIEGLANEVEASEDNTLDKAVQAYLAKQHKDLSWGRRKALKATGRGLIEHTLLTLRHTAREADKMRLGVLSTLGSVDQYAFDGGAYTVTKAQREEALNQLKALNQDSNVSPVLEQAKSLDMLVNASPVRQKPLPVETWVEAADPVEAEESDTRESEPTDSVWGELGTPKVAHDPVLLKFFKENPQPELKDVLKMLRGQISQPGRTNEFYTALWKQLVKHVNPGLKIQYVTPDTPMPEGVDGDLAQRARGLYTFSDSGDTLYIKGDQFSYSGITAEMLMHELVHAVVARTIDMAEQGKPLPDTAELVQELQVLLDRARKHVADKPELARKHQNALANLQEFVAWGMTNTAFQREVLNEFTIQTKTSRNALFTGMKAFVNTLRDIIFRGSSKSEQQIQVTGLKTLFANVAGLMSTAEQAREQAAATRSFAMADPVLEMEVGDLFDGLANPQAPLDSAFQDHLRGLLDTLVRPLHGPYGVIRVEAMDNQAIGVRERFLQAIDEGQAPFVSQVSASIPMSDQEALLTESIEVALRTALDSKDRSVSLNFRELKELYNSVKRQYGQNDAAFHEGDWNTASPAEKAQAKALREAFLDIPAGEEQSAYLSRFAALGLANATLNRLLKQTVSSNTRSLADLGWMDRLQAIVENLMQFLAGKLTHTWEGQQADDKLQTLVKSLVSIEAKYREKAARPRNRWFEQAEDMLDSVQEQAKGKVVELAQSTRIRDSKTAAVRVLGRVTSLAAQDRLEAIMDAGKTLRDRMFNERQGFIAGTINEMRGPIASMLSLLNIAKRNEQHRQHLNTWTQKTVLGGFANAGKNLTAKHKKALALVLRADFASLLNHNYSLQEIQSLLAPGTALAERIKEVKGQLGGATHYRMYVERARALGVFMVTNKATINDLMLNAENIARMYRTPQANSVSEAEVKRVTPLIDELASLYALEAADQSTKDTINDVMAIEMARTDGGNGILMTAKLHAELQKQALETLFVGTESMFIKGYTPEIHNPYTEVLAATEEEGKLLIKQGYQRVYDESLPRDQDDPDRRPKHLYVLKNRGMQRRVSGALSLTGEHAKGSAMRSDVAAWVTGNPLAYNQPLIQQLAQAKLQRGSRSSGQDAYMVPTLNAAGEAVDYRYIMSSKVRDTLLERENSFEILLGTLNGNLYDKQVGKEQNREVIKALHEQWKTEQTTRRDAYIKVSPDSKDPEAQEAWRLLPYHTQEAIRSIWGSNGMMVRNDQIDLIMGYRKYSMAQLFDKPVGGLKNVLKKQQGEERMIQERVLAWLLKDVFQLGDKAALRVRQAEDIWQGIVQEVKDIVVVRSGITLYWNVVSNMTLLLWQGVPIKDLLRNHYVAWRGVVNYRKDSEELFKLEAAIKTGTAGDQHAAVQRVRQLQDALARNPAKELIDAGMLPTIVEDVAMEEDPYSYRSQLKQKVDDYTGWVHPGVKKAVAYAYIAPGTPLHSMMTHATQYSDFVARYTLYQHLVSRRKAPKSKQEALKIISDSFINYDIPSHKMMQYMNDMGLLMFTKYYLRIQKVIMQMFRDHPLRAIMMLTLDHFLQGAQTIVDSSMVGRLGNPLEWGALQYPGSLDELATIKGLMGILK